VQVLKLSHADPGRGMVALGVLKCCERCKDKKKQIKKINRTGEPGKASGIPSIHKKKE